jgi:nucleoside-diphosphate-sugar epimerase
MTLNKNNPILVTGGGGYIASWIIKYLLEDGFKVHTTIRKFQDKEKYQHLTNLAESHKDNLTFFEADLLVPDSFYSSMEGCEIVIHTASPFIVSKIKDPDLDLIKPAKEGTANVLKSVNSIQSIKRVVLTSSCAAIYGDNIDFESIDKESFTEEFWNTTSNKNHNPYSYSKTLAEKEAWDIAGKQDRWDLVVINPAFVMGPSLSKRIDSTSVQTMQQLCNGTFLLGVPELWFGITDVRDVAKAHILASLKENAKGRHIICSDSLTMLDMAKILKDKVGNKFLLPSTTIPYFLIWLFGPLLGFNHSYIEKNIGYTIKFDNSYTKKDLGLEFTDVKKTIIDHVEQLIQDHLI